MKPRALAFALTLALAAPAVLAGQPGALQLQRSLGGQIVEPVLAGSRTYLPSGSVILTIDYADPQAPVVTGSTDATPASGTIVGLTRRGDYLYAARNVENADSSGGGISIYSLADPDRPALVAEIDDYTSAPFREVQSIAAGADHLYLFDSQNGLFVGDLSNPQAPVFSHAIEMFGSFQRAYAQGDRLYSIGRSWVSQTIFNIYDIGAPAAPISIGSAAMDGFNNFSLKLNAPLAYGFGIGLSIHDFSDPTDIHQRGYADGPATLNGMVIGQHAYALGDVGIGIWNVANPDQPVAAGQSPIDSVGPAIAVPVSADAGLMATRTDRIVRLSTTTPTQPQVVSELLVPGGVETADIVFTDDAALLLGSTYGLQFAAAGSLAPQGRFEPPGLSPLLRDRSFEEVAIAGNRAFLASWGSGVFIVDIADPSAPALLGHLPFAAATTVDVQGDFAYVGQSTGFDSVLGVIDVSDPTQPSVRGTLPVVHTLRLRVHGQYVFAADEGAGLLVIDVSNPDAPFVAATYTDQCQWIGDLALDEAGTTLYLGCESGLHIVDVGTPTLPQRLGLYPGDDSSARRVVAVSGDRAYIGPYDANGFREVDVSTPATPTLIAEHATPEAPRRIRTAPGGRVFALHYTAGMYVYAGDGLFADGFESD